MTTGPQPWARVPSVCTDATRVLFVTYMDGDTFVVEDEGEVSLADSETLKRLITQLSDKGGQA